MTIRQKLIIIGSIIAAFVLAFIVSGVLQSLKKEMTPPEPPKIVRKVKSALVEYSDVSSQVSATGRVISQQSVDVISEVQGRLEEGSVPLKKGSNFNKGDLLVKIFNDDAFFALQSRKSAFLNSLANILPDMKVDYPDSYQPWIDFFESVTIKTDLPPLPEIKSNQEKIFLSSRGVLSEYFGIKSDEVRLRKYSIYAPYAGAFQDVMLEVGSVANPGSRIAKIIKTSELEVEVPVQTNEAGWIKIGSRGIIASEYGDTIGRGVISRKSSFVDPSSQSINIYIKISYGSKPVYSGQYVQVIFPGMNVSNGMEIPRRAIFNSDQIFVIDSGLLALRTVNVLKVNENTIIFNGLDEGTEIVTEPLGSAREKTRVQSEYTKPPEPDTTSKANMPEEEAAEVPAE